MAYRFFTRIPRARLLASGAGFGGTAFTIKETFGTTEAEKQFGTSSVHPSPQGYERWEIRNDYPTSDILKSQIKSSSSMPALPLPGYGSDFEGKNAPWLKLDFKKEPKEYGEIIREYCFAGMRPEPAIGQRGFQPRDNPVRDWYHAPWMHYCPKADKDGGNEREPLNGFTFERATPAKEFAETQKHWLQNWACGFYNATGATVFGDMWKNPNKPNFDNDKKFPVGTCVFKILLNDATNDELPIMAGSPGMKAIISAASKDDPVPMKAGVRNTEPPTVRLIQVDFAVVDDRSPIGWVFGTYMYNGNLTHIENPWDRLTLVGLQWGNDPELTQAVYDKDPKNRPKPTESWINPDADKIRISLKGSRPSWGWNGRMNGPADNYVSACASCHSTASRDPMPGPNYGLTPPSSPDKAVMTYFRNVPPGVPFDQSLNTEGSKTKSADYSLQLQMEWSLYNQWKRDNESILGQTVRKTKYVWTGNNADPADPSQRELLRQGPQLEYETREKKN